MAMRKKKSRKDPSKDSFYRKTAIGDLLLRFLIKNKLTNKDFAEFLGVDESYISLITRGRRIPQKISFLRRLSQATGIHLDILQEAVLSDIRNLKEASLSKES